MDDAERLGKPTRRVRTRWTLLDKFYEVGVILKGLDGLVEFLVGVLLLVAPGAPHRALSAVAAEAAESSAPIRQFIAAYVENLDHQLARAGLTFLVVFLIVHGLIKLALVYFLLRKIHRAYPYAIVALVALLGYQLYTLLTSPTIGMLALSLLDAVIIVLVYREYREIKARETSQDSGGGNSPSG